MRRFVVFLGLLAATPAWAQSAFDGTYFGTYFRICHGEQSDGSTGFSIANGLLYYVARPGDEPQTLIVQANGTLSGHVRGGLLSGRAVPPHLDFTVQNGDCSISYVLDRR